MKYTALIIILIALTGCNFLESERNIDSAKRLINAQELKIDDLTKQLDVSEKSKKALKIKRNDRNEYISFLERLIDDKSDFEWHNGLYRRNK